MTKETKSGEGKVSKRRSKDENAPKRARSAYMFFCQEKRKSIVEENPGVGFGKEKLVSIHPLFLTCK